jgi:hypothetical protein
MNQITIINPSRMSNGAHYAFHADMLACLQADPKVSAKVSESLRAYRQAFEAEDTALAISRKSFLTDAIAKADDERDALYIGLKANVKMFALNASADKREACKVLTQALKDYNINPRDHLEKETGLLTNLLDDLRGKYRAQVAALSLEGHVDDLYDANERVRVAMLARNNESSLKTVGALRDARAETDAAYTAVVSLVNALAMVEGDADYMPFIRQAGTLTERYRRQAMGAKAAKPAKDDGKEDGKGDGKEPGKDDGKGDGKEPGKGDGKDPGDGEIPDPVAPSPGTGGQSPGHEEELPDPLA